MNDALAPQVEWHGYKKDLLKGQSIWRGKAILGLAWMKGALPLQGSGMDERCFGPTGGVAWMPDALALQGSGMDERRIGPTIME